MISLLCELFFLLYLIVTLRGQSTNTMHISQWHKKDVSEVQDNTEVHPHYEEFKEEHSPDKKKAPAVVEVKLRLKKMKIQL